MDAALPQGSDSPLRRRLGGFIDQPYVQRGIVALILVNAAILGLETSAPVMSSMGGILMALDAMILAVFVVEIAIRLYVHRLGFWRDPWRVFDFLVIAIALIPAAGPFAVLRALRVLRVLTVVPSMRKVVGALLAAIPGLGSIALVLCILYYVFAVAVNVVFLSEQQHGQFPYRNELNDMQHWMEKQVYLVLGTLLLGAAVLGSMRPL